MFAEGRPRKRVGSGVTLNGTRGKAKRITVGVQGRPGGRRGDAKRNRKRSEADAGHIDCWLSKSLHLLFVSVYVYVLFQDLIILL